MKVKVVGTVGLCDARLEITGKHRDETALVIVHPNGESVYADPETVRRQVDIRWATKDEWIDLLKYGYAG